MTLLKRQEMKLIKDEVIVDVNVNVSLDVDVSPTFFPKVEENKN